MTVRRLIVLIALVVVAAGVTWRRSLVASFGVASPGVASLGVASPGGVSPGNNRDDNRRCDFDARLTVRSHHLSAQSRLSLVRAWFLL